PRLRPDRGADRLEVGLVDEVEAEPEAGEDLVHQAVGAAVEVGGQDQVVAGAARGGDQRVLGRHPARERRGETALQLPQGALERRSRGVGRARVVVVLDELARRPLHVGRGLVDRRDDGPVGRVRVEPGVHGAGGEADPVRQPRHLASDSTRSARVTIPTGLPSEVTSSASVCPLRSSTASRTLSSAGTAWNGGSMTSITSASRSEASSTAWRRSPRSLRAPAIVCGSCAETTGTWETRCSCMSATASRTLAWVSTVKSGGISPSACLRRRTSPTVSSAVRSRKPYWRIQASL